MLLDQRIFSIAMFNRKAAAESYQQISRYQREFGEQFIQDELNPLLQHGDAILDLGCGTGELSAYVAELVGQQGKVLGVDPDIDRIKVAQESHKGVKNLSFVEGSTSNFPNMGSKSYNIVFSNFVLHWVQNKDEAFRNMFSSLKPDGKIVICYEDHFTPLLDRIFRELNPENFERLRNMHKFEMRPDIEEMCAAAGFNILKSYHVKMREMVFENGENLRSFFWATTHGVFDPQFVTEDRLASFCARYSSGEDDKIRLSPGENDFISVLSAVKPAKI